MKKKRWLVVLFLIAFCFTAGAEVNQKPQKFKVTYTIVYNSITLEEASKLEKKIKKTHKKACSIDINLKALRSGEDLTFTVDDTSWVTVSTDDEASE